MTIVQAGLILVPGIEAVTFHVPTLGPAFIGGAVATPLRSVLVVAVSLMMKLGPSGPLSGLLAPGETIH